MEINNPKLKFTGMVERNNPLNIIIHHALKKECTIQDIHSWHLQNGWIGCGYHYFVRKSGIIDIGRPEVWVGSHCKEEGMNYKSIGICVEGCYEDYPSVVGADPTDMVTGANMDKEHIVGSASVGSQTDKEMPKEQLAALIELTKYLINKYKIPVANVSKHNRYAPYKLCPGNYFPWEGFKLGISSNVSQEIQYGLDAIQSLADMGLISNPERWKKSLIAGEQLPAWLQWVILNRIAKGGVK